MLHADFLLWNQEGPKVPSNFGSKICRWKLSFQAEVAHTEATGSRSGTVKAGAVEILTLRGHER